MPRVGTSPCGPGRSASSAYFLPLPCEAGDYPPCGSGVSEMMARPGMWVCGSAERVRAGGCDVCRQEKWNTPPYARCAALLIVSARVGLVRVP